LVVETDEKSSKQTLPVTACADGTVSGIVRRAATSISGIRRNSVLVCSHEAPFATTNNLAMKNYS
jgi:hypothetical protein